MHQHNTRFILSSLLLTLLLLTFGSMLFTIHAGVSSSNPDQVLITTTTSDTDALASYLSSSYVKNPSVIYELTSCGQFILQADYCGENFIEDRNHLLKDKRMLAIEPDITFSSSYSGTPTQATDEKYTEDNTWFLDDIQASDAYEYLKAQDSTKAPGEGVLVAVLDSGICVNSFRTTISALSGISASNYAFHPDLKNQIWINTQEKDGVDGVDDDDNGYIDDYYGINLTTSDTNANYSDNHTTDDGTTYNNKIADNYIITDDETYETFPVYHGTHVSGLIAMEANNHIGSAGVAYGATIMPVKVCASDGTSRMSTIIKGIQYAIANGAQVINISIGNEPGGTIDVNSVNVALPKAIEDATNAGCIVVGAAGNNGVPTTKVGDQEGFQCYPAYHSGILGVMSSNKEGLLSYFTNWDTTPNDDFGYNLVAPGGYGGTATTREQNIFSTSYYPASGAMYAYMAGTSMASPIAAGAAAIVLNRLRRYDLYSVANLRYQLTKSTTKTTTYMGGTYTYPHLNLLDSLTTGLLAPKPFLSGIAVDDNGAFSIHLKNSYTPLKDIQISYAFRESDKPSDFLNTVSGSAISLASLDADGSFTQPCNSTFGITSTYPLQKDEKIVLPIQFKVEARNGVNENDTTDYTQVLQYRLNVTTQGISLTEEDYSALPANPNHTPGPIPTPITSSTPSPTPDIGKASPNVSSTPAIIDSPIEIAPSQTPAVSNTNGSDDLSAKPVVVTQEPTTEAPETPSSGWKKPTITVKNHRYAKLSWRSFKGSTGICYTVYRSTQKRKAYRKLATVTSKTSYTDKKLKTGKLYYYKICYRGKYSKVCQIFVPKKQTLRGVILNRRNTMQITIKKQKGITGYSLWYSRTKNGTYRLRASYRKQISSISVARKSKTYYYRVCAYRTVDGKRCYGKPCAAIRLKR